MAKHDEQFWLDAVRHSPACTAKYPARCANDRRGRFRCRGGEATSDERHGRTGLVSVKHPQAGSRQYIRHYIHRNRSTPKPEGLSPVQYRVQAFGSWRLDANFLGSAHWWRGVSSVAGDQRMVMVVLTVRPCAAQRAVTVFVWVQNCTACLPLGPRSPSLDAREPVKLNHATGTGIGMLMPT